MAYNYTTCNRGQLYLLAPSMKDWLDEDHFVWFLLDAIEHMDLSAFHAAHHRDGEGQKAHHPEIILAVTLYGYCHGERSSRSSGRSRTHAGWTASVGAGRRRATANGP